MTAKVQELLRMIPVKYHSRIKGLPNIFMDLEVRDQRDNSWWFIPEWDHLHMVKQAYMKKPHWFWYPEGEGFEDVKSMTICDDVVVFYERKGPGGETHPRATVLTLSKGTNQYVFETSNE